MALTCAQGAAKHGEMIMKAKPNNKPPRRGASVVQSLAIRSHGKSRPLRRSSHSFSQSLPLVGRQLDQLAAEPFELGCDAWKRWPARRPTPSQSLRCVDCCRAPESNSTPMPRNHWSPSSPRQPHRPDGAARLRAGLQSACAVRDWCDLPNRVRTCNLFHSRSRAFGVSAMVLA